MKKVVVILLLCIIGISPLTFAGDIPEGLMRGEQQALFIGELTHIGESTYRMKPLTIMMGDVSKEEITVNRVDKYYGTDVLPKVEDIVVVVLLEEGLINNFWFFKATSSDYRTLKLVSENYNMVKRYETYINEGKYFEAQERLEREAEEKNKATNSDENNKKDLEMPTEQVNSKTQGSGNRRTFIILGATFIIALYIGYRRAFIKDK